MFLFYILLLQVNVCMARWVGVVLCIYDLLVMQVCLCAKSGIYGFVFMKGNVCFCRDNDKSILLCVMLA